MQWKQRFAPRVPEDVHVKIQVDTWSDESNRQIMAFVRGLIADGFTIGGYDNESGSRILYMGEGRWTGVSTVRGSARSAERGCVVGVGGWRCG